MLGIEIDATFDELIDPDLVVFPGGHGTRVLMTDEGVLDWVRTAHRGARITTSVCTGVDILLMEEIEARCWFEKKRTSRWGEGVASSRRSLHRQTMVVCCIEAVTATAGGFMFSLGKTVRSLCVALLFTATTPFVAKCAFADYRVWYFDDVYETFQLGDVTDGTTLLGPPPPWACGVRFIDPQYYRWVDGYFNTMSSADFYKDVTVWMPLGGGCPGGPTIEYTDGSQSFPHPAGASHMEITSPNPLHVGGCGWPMAGV